MKKYKLILIVVILIIIISVVFQLYQLNEIKNNLRIEDIKATDFGFGGTILPLLQIPSEIKFNLIASVNNPTPYNLDIEKITFNIKFGDKILTSGYNENMVI